MTLQKQLKTTKKYINLLADNGITSLKELLLYFPRTYEDRSQIHNLKDISIDIEHVVSTKGKIIAKNMFYRNRKKIFDIQFIDPDGNKGYISIFNSPYQAQQIQQNKWYIIIGKPSFKYNKITFSHPDVVETAAPEEEQDIDAHNVGRIYPIYPELQGIKPGRFAKKIWTILDNISNEFTEYLPNKFRKKYNLPHIHETVKHIHFPDDMEDNKSALRRIFFERILKVQLASQMQKYDYQSGVYKDIEQSPQREVVKKIVSTLPFELTAAQKKVTKDIIENLHDPKPMLKLLQGDVGSGKTIVATIAAYYMKQELQAQSVFIAPLEILAQQHHKNIAKILLPLGLRVELLTGSLTKRQKDKIKTDLVQGKIDVIVGTHALVQEGIQFHNLQLAVIDEQHKFGVKQRAFFKQFDSPHILQMSATPIPRSMALAFFGEFTVSIIDELPTGRLPIHTKIISEKDYHRIKPRLYDRIKKGEKVFLVTPLIEESDKLEDVKAATAAFEEAKEFFREIHEQIGLLHGKMKPKDKEYVMQQFKDGNITMLVATTVIEVGVDIPEATVMVIKNAERFGLSQLHQLRGRIGRSHRQSYCFLETAKKSGETYKRLKAMEDSNDGFKLAELDLEYRGAGEILGTRQSGIGDVPMEILTDVKFLEKVQEAAIRLLERYPQLEGLEELQKEIGTQHDNLIA